MSWPTTVLNVTNRRLVEDVKRLTGELTAQQSACEQHREVLELMRVNLSQTKEQSKHVELILTDACKAMAQEESSIKELKNECDGAARRAKQLDADRTRLWEMIQQVHTATSAKLAALQENHTQSELLEDMVKQAVLHHIARQKVGKELEAESTKLSSTVTAKLAGLHDEVKQQERSLVAAIDEHKTVLTALGRVRNCLKEIAKDRVEGVQALALVIKQCEEADKGILHNVDTATNLQAQMAEKVKVRQGLHDRLAELQRTGAKSVKAREVKRQIYDARVNTLREVMTSLHEAAGPAEALRRQLDAGRQYARQLRSSLDDLIVRSTEKKRLLDSNGETYSRLREVSQSILQQEEEDGTSPAQLERLYAGLFQNLQALERRAENIQAYVSRAIAELVQEGRYGDVIQEKLSYTKLTQRSLYSEAASVRERQGETARALQAMENRLSAMREQLSETQSAAATETAVHRHQLEESVAQLKDQLQTSSDQHRQLVRDLSALRSALYRGTKALEEVRSQRMIADSANSLHETEVSRLEAELHQLGQTVDNCESQETRATVTLKSMQAAAREQLGSVRNTAGMDAHLRAFAQIEDAHIESDMHSAKVELHLHQGARRELGEELRRHQRRRDLLQSRYAELMQSLAARQRAEGGPLVELPTLNTEATPIALHARLLLQRSFEREELMEKGNYLDVRLLSVERETQNLQRVLETMRLEKASTTIEGGNLQVTPPKQCPKAALGSTSSAAGSLQEGLLSRQKLLQVELARQEEALKTMGAQRDSARDRMRRLTQTLKTLKTTEKQKQKKLLTLREEVHKEACRGIPATSVARTSS